MRDRPVINTAEVMVRRAGEAALMGVVGVDATDWSGMWAAVNVVYGETLASAPSSRPASRVCGRHKAAMPCPALKQMADATTDALRESHGAVVIELMTALALAVVQLAELQQISTADAVERLAGLVTERAS